MKTKQFLLAGTRFLAISIFSAFLGVFAGVKASDKVEELAIVSESVTETPVVNFSLINALATVNESVLLPITVEKYTYVSPSKSDAVSVDNTMNALYPDSRRQRQCLTMCYTEQPRVNNLPFLRKARGDTIDNNTS